MNIVIRNSIKILLLNNEGELLLMCADDPKTTSADGSYHGRFWSLIGGEIEKKETIQEAAIRELYEETGLNSSEVDFGPVVWFGEFQLILSGKLTLLKQRFIVAKTKNNSVTLDNLTKQEKEVIKQIAWFSLEGIKNCSEVIYPVVLPEYLEDIIVGKYPPQPIEIDLAKQPKNKNK